MQPCQRPIHEKDTLRGGVPAGREGWILDVRRSGLKRILMAAGGWAVATVSCTPPEAGLPSHRDAADREGIIAFVGASENDELWEVLRASAYREIEVSPNYTLRAAAPRIRSVNAQIKLINEFRGRDLLGLCVQPVDPTPLLDTLKQLRTEGVAVVTLMTEIPSGPQFPHAGLDDFSVGEAAADALNEALGGEGTAAVLYNAGGAEEHLQCHQGFLKRIKQRPAISILRQFDCRGSVFEAQRMMAEYMERFPRLNAWVSMSNWPLQRRRFGEEFLPSTCTLISVGPYPEYWPYIADGTCYAMVGAQYDQISRYALQMCISLIRGEKPVVHNYLAPAVTVTRNNLADYRMQWFAWREMPKSARSGR